MDLIGCHGAGIGELSQLLSASTESKTKVQIHSLVVHCV